jgi:hypothetical protein
VTVVAYRHAAYDSPWRVIPSARAGRFNRADEEEPTQYLAMHPLGPTAELLRHQLRGPNVGWADTILANLWAVLVEVGAAVVDITFDNCAADTGSRRHSWSAMTTSPPRSWPHISVTSGQEASRCRRPRCPGPTI